MGQCSFSNQLAPERHNGHSFALMSEIMTLSDFRKSAESKTYTGRTTAGNSLDQFFAHYTLCGGIIGQGKVGTVRQVLYRPTDQQRAVKIVSKHINNKQFYKLCLQEVKILGSLDHSNIVRLFDHTEDNNDFYIATELARGENLLSHLNKNGPMPEKVAIPVMRQVLSALRYLHARNIVHRDIKLQHIIFNGSIIKLVDFGTSKELGHDQRLRSLKGSAQYMAPEVILRSYSFECDVWAAGVVLVSLLTGHFPFQGSSKTEIMCNILSTKLDYESNMFSHLSRCAKDLLASMLEVNRSKRITASQAISHEWFAEPILPNPQTGCFRKTQQIAFADPLQTIAYRLIVVLTDVQVEKGHMIERFYHYESDCNRKLSKSNLTASQTSCDHTNFTNQPKNEPRICELTEIIGFTDFLSNYSDPRQLVNENSIDLAFNYLNPDRCKALIASETLDRAAPFFRNKQEWHILTTAFLEKWPSSITYHEFKSTVLSLRD